MRKRGRPRPEPDPLAPLKLDLEPFTLPDLAPLDLPAIGPLELPELPELPAIELEPVEIDLEPLELKLDPFPELNLDKLPDPLADAPGPARKRRKRARQTHARPPG